MLGALLYLRLTSLKNQIVSRAKRLRQPKYLAGALAGAAYFYFIFFRQISGPSPGSKRAARQAAEALPLPTTLADTLPLVAALGALCLLGIVLFAWLLPSGKPGLRFTEAETAFLFSAPISRRTLINFKLLSSQFSILFTSLFFTLISNRWSFLGGNALTHAFGWWFVLSTLNLHFTGAALTISRLVDGGVSALRRRLYVLGTILVVVAATVAWVGRDLHAPGARDVAGFAPFIHYLLGILDHGALGMLLIPFKFVLGPFLAADVRTFLYALAPALLVLAAHYRWVLGMETSFEEASIALAEKRAATLDAVRDGKHPLLLRRSTARPAPFNLADTGRPEFAFLWKNLLSTASYFNVRAFAIAAAVIIVGSRWFLSPTPGDQAVRFVVITLASMSGVYILIFGPHLARQDLRSDLANADILKTYPLPGWQLILGQLLAPLVILTGLVWLTLLATALAFPPPGRLALTFTPTVRLALALGLAALTPFLCALQLLVLNGATLIFPAWFQTTRSQGGGGIELMGQRLIFFVGQLIVMLVAILPAAIAGGAAFGVTWFAFHFTGHTAFASPSAISAAVLVCLGVLAGEVAAALWWLGERFAHLDVSAELRP